MLLGQKVKCVFPEREKGKKKRKKTFSSES